MKKPAPFLADASYLWPSSGADGRNVYVAFRLVLNSLPARAESASPVRVSAASFYRLWVNGAYVGRGPVREWQGHIGIDPWDLGPLLRLGRNVISALVHFYGAADLGALQLTRGGFLLQGVVSGRSVSTGVAGWECRVLEGWRPDAPRISLYNGFCEDVDLPSCTPGFWERGVDARGWQKPAVVRDATKHWPRPEQRIIPPLRESDLPLRLIACGTVRWPDSGSWAERVAARNRQPAPERIRILGNPWPIRILPGKPLHLLLDAGDMTSGGVRLRLHAGGGETVYVTYADRFTPDGNPDATHGGINNNVDRLILRPGLNRWESQLNLRAFRYLDLTCFDLREPLVIAEVAAREIIYPVETRGRFACSDPVWNRIWSAAVRTASLCMADTYMDNPSRERQQYGGDGRLQARYAWDYFGDERLTRQFLRQYGQGIRPDGAIQSGGPWCWNQIIPAWQLHWIEATREYVERSGDMSVLAEIATPAAATLEWMHTLLAPDGLLAVREKFEYAWPNSDVLWNFMDWQGCEDQVGGDFARIPLNCLYHQALKTAAAVFRQAGHPRRAIVLDRRRRALGRRLRSLFTAHTGHDSEHVLTFATLAGLVRGRLARVAATMASGRFSTDLLGLPFLLDALACDGYAAEAIAGVRNVCARILDEEGTTCFETREAKRSAAGRAYCQGASAFAGTYMLRLLAGIRPAPYPRRQVRIQPCCADLEWLTATLPLPDGEVTVQIEKTRKGTRVRTTVPLGWTGVSEPPAVSSATM